MTRKLLFSIAFAALLAGFMTPLMITKAWSADSNTVSSTVVTDKAPPTANAPSVVVNNSDICKSGAAASIQTQVLGVATGITITDKNCERLKLSRSLYAMGMKVAAVSTLCQDPRVFDSMWMSGTPCPFMGKIGDEAKLMWQKNVEFIPEESEIRVREEVAIIVRDEEAAIAANKIQLDKIAANKALKSKQREALTQARDQAGEFQDADKKSIWANPLGLLLMVFLL
jgi:hypothetical protein|tara:strand:- start:11431 stop:12111 length:681 start_codon:yes stop_codon:yes gene_type:complete